MRTFFFSLFFLAAAVSGRGDIFTLLFVDPLVKIQRTADPSAFASFADKIEAVRGEYESVQLLLVANQALASVSVQVEPLEKPGENAPQVEAGFLGYVPIRHGTSQTEPEDLVALAPTELPDPIMDLETVAVSAGTNQPIWLTVFVPRKCPPGGYSYRVVVAADGHTQALPLTVNVLPITLPAEQQLLVTNWIYLDAIQKHYGLERWSEPFWDKLREYAEFISRYRQNVICSPIFELIEITDLGANQYGFDFSRFDRWVNLFAEAGVSARIEGSHLAHRTVWDAPSFNGASMAMRTRNGGLAWKNFPDAHDEAYTNLLRQLLPALQNHLEERGWLDRYLQHVADEPINENIERYLELMALMREVAPKLRATDSTACLPAFDATDVPVVSLEEIDKHQDHVLGNRAAGKEVWMYTCLNPRGPFLNRLIDFHLIRTRLLHWLNFHYDLPGYGHWALNFWPDKPLEKVEEENNQPPLPPGDTHIIYPGKSGILSSIRLEAMRDGIEEHELLKLLEQQDPELARSLAANVVRSGTDYVRDPAEFRRFRQQLLTALMEKKS